MKVCATRNEQTVIDQVRYHSLLLRYICHTFWNKSHPLDIMHRPPNYLVAFSNSIQKSILIAIRIHQLVHVMHVDI